MIHINQKALYHHTTSTLLVYFSLLIMKSHKSTLNTVVYSLEISSAYNYNPIQENLLFYYLLPLLKFTIATPTTTSTTPTTTTTSSSFLHHDYCLS